MHEKLTTRGCVVSTSAYREADKIISIYTEDFGLISAVATGIRRSASKLRYHAQDYSVRHFSLVRGRDLWRFVGAEEMSGVARIDSPDNLAAYARVLSLVRRLVRGEEENKPLFETLFILYGSLAGGIAKADLPTVEAVAVFRLLHSLGYIKEEGDTSALVSAAAFDSGLIDLARPITQRLVAAINAGLAASHL